MISAHSFKWKIIFEPAEFFHYPTRNPENVEFKKVASDEVQVIWKEEYWLNNGYYVYLDGKLLGYTPRGMFPIKGLEAGKKYTVEIETIWEDGTVSAKKSKLEFTLD